MIDTLRFRLFESGGLPSSVPAGWDFRYSVSRDVHGSEAGASVEPDASGQGLRAGERVRWMFQRESDGLRIGAEAPAGTEATWPDGWVEVSLPRVVFGDNGRLLRDAASVAEACEAVRAVVREVLPRWSGDWRPVRVDAVWQVRSEGGCGPVLRAFAPVPHPRLRKAAPAAYAGESVSWRGKSTMLRMYDKRAEACGAPGDVLRVEAQFRGPAASKVVGEARTVYGGEACEVDPLAAYRRLAAVAGQLGRTEIVRPASVGAFFASALASGDPMAHHLLATMPPRTRRFWRARLRAEVTRTLWDWASVLPADAPPSPVDLEPEAVA